MEEVFLTTIYLKDFALAVYTYSAHSNCAMHSPTCYGTSIKADNKLNWAYLLDAEALWSKYFNF